MSGRESGNRTTWSRRAFLSAPAGSAAFATGVQRAPHERPNILWLTGEDMCPDLGCYGNRSVRTPHIDGLAKQGIRFDHVFATGPICSPSRSAIATGVYQTSIGAQHQRSHRDDGYIPPAPIRLFTHLLREAGYHTSNVHQPAPGVRATGKTDFNFHAERVFDGDDWSGRSTGQPFFAHVNFSEAHRPFRRSTPAVDPVSVDLPPYLDDHPAVRQDWAMYLESIQSLDGKIGAVLNRLQREGLDGNTIVVFFGDNGREMPRGKLLLYDGGIHVPLIVRFPAKFQPPGVQAGSVRRELVSLMDITATTLELAGVQTPKWMHARPLYGPRASAREYVVSARDRCDWSADRIRCVRTSRFKYIRNFHPSRPYAQPDPYMDTVNIPLIVARQLERHGGRSAARKLVTAASRASEELYAMDADPHEVTNLASDPRHAAELVRLRGVLDKWIRETGDKGEIPEGKLPALYDRWSLIDGWASTGDCRILKRDGVLRLECSGRRNVVQCGIVVPGGDCRLAFRIRSTRVTRGSVSWGTVSEPADPKNRSGFELPAGAAMHEVDIRFRAGGYIAWVGFDFGAVDGIAEIETIRLARAMPHGEELLKQWRF